MKGDDKTKEQLINKVEILPPMVHIQGKPVLQGIFGDITERRKADEALGESEEFSSSLLSYSPNPTLVINPDTSIRYVNPALENLTSFASAELIGRKAPYPWWPEERLDKATRDFGRAIRKGAEGIEELFQKKNGERFWVEITSTPVRHNGRFKYYLANWVDITQRKQAEERLQELGEELRRMFESVTDGITVTDLGGIITYVNKRVVEMHGFGSKDEVLGKSIFDLIARGDYERAEANMRKTLEEEAVTGIEYTLVRAEGSEFPCELSASVLKGASNNSVGFITVTRDITERKRALEYEELNRLKSDLLSTVSHELRTPLATIKGYSTMLVDYDRRLGHEEKRECLQSIDKATDRLTELVDHLLDMSRLDAGLLKMERKPTGISRLVREAVAEAKLRAPRHKIVLKVRKGLPRVNIDAKRVRQVLDNLIDNSIKYSEEGSSVVVCGDRVGSELHISVADQGIGISAENLLRVFERMYRIGQRLTQGMGGLGLGLSICKGLVEAHGGHIWMESEEGKGSKCSFTLPIETRKAGMRGKDA